MQTHPIELKGGRQNNLKNIDLEIPKNKLIVFAGISGSGKSSLVFDTIAAESQRQMNLTYPAFIQSLMNTGPSPKFDSLRHLSPSISIDQEMMGNNPRSTLGTVTDILSKIKSVFFVAGTPSVSSINELSFNHPDGMCPDCQGLGKRNILETEKILDSSLSLNEGAINFPNFQVGSLFWKVYADSGFFDNDKPLKLYSEHEWNKLLHGLGGKVNTGSYNLAYEGLSAKIKRLYLSKDIDTLKPHVQRALRKSAKIGTCSSCKGSRLNAKALSCMVNGLNLGTCCSIPIDELIKWIGQIDDNRIKNIIKSISGILSDMIELGLGHLSLNRPTSTLSGGECQRVKLVRHMESTLEGMLYIFDEPSSGLHPKEVSSVISYLRRLRDCGNTILVVSHNKEILQAANLIIEIGPKAGSDGGYVEFKGNLSSLLTKRTPTAMALNSKHQFKDVQKKPIGYMQVGPSKKNNLKNIHAKIPLGVFVAITGISGAGKSSLMESIPITSETVVLNQSTIKGSIRSNPATYSGLMEGIRKLFSKENTVAPGMFSSNSKGACKSCKGLGFVSSDIAYMNEVAIPCTECEGKRFSKKILDYKVKGKNIVEVLEMSISECREFFKELLPTDGVWKNLELVGIGYIRMGQPLNTLSGGERQRLKLAIEMTDGSKVFLLDEPSRGLHDQDVQRLLDIIESIIDDGGSVIAVEHNLKMILGSDWIIDMGPGAGKNGGEILYSGVPSKILKQNNSVTGLAIQTTFKSQKV